MRFVVSLCEYSGDSGMIRWRQRPLFIGELGLVSGVGATVKVCGGI